MRYFSSKFEIRQIDGSRKPSVKNVKKSVFKQLYLDSLVRYFQSAIDNTHKQSDSLTHCNILFFNNFHLVPHLLLE